MGLGDIVLIIIFGLCLPTWDIYTDILLAYDLFQPKCYEPPTAFTYMVNHGYNNYYGNP